MPRRIPDDELGRKFCGTCDQYRNKTCFTKCRTNPDGLCYECKDCVRTREQNRKHLKKEYDQQRRATEEHRAKSREQAGQWRRANHKRHSELQRRWAKTTKGQQYINGYAPQRRINGRRYTKTHPVKFQIKSLLRRTRKSGNGGSFTHTEWEALKASFGYACLRCGQVAPQITLTADHVIPLSRGGDSNISNIQPLCLSCNSSKGARSCADYR